MLLVIAGLTSEGTEKMLSNYVYELNNSNYQRFFILIKTTMNIMKSNIIPTATCISIVSVTFSWSSVKAGLELFLNRVYFLIN